MKSQSGAGATARSSQTGTVEGRCIGKFTDEGWGLHSRGEEHKSQSRVSIYKVGGRCTL